jgi:hypothetical protein
MKHMDQLRSGRHIRKLWVLSLTGAAFIGLFHYRQALTGMHKVDGVICVMLGLYLCTHPAAYALDMLFFERNAGQRFSSARSAVLWAALNMLVLLTGWFIIFIGTTRLVDRAD